MIIVGDRDHSEVKGLSGYASSFTVIQNIKEAESLSLSGRNAVIAQTTLRQEVYEDICSVIRAKDPNAEIVMSICSATEGAAGVSG